MSSGDTPVAGIFCATYLEPEMLHVHRHVLGLTGFAPVVLTQKHKGTWEGPVPRVVSKSSFREWGRLKEKWTGGPWQAGCGETSEICNILHRENCSLLHIFFGSAAIHWLRLMRECPVPVVVSFHGSDVAGAMTSPGYRRALDEMFQLAARVPCRSEHLATQVRELGCPGEKIRVMRAVLPVMESVQKSPPEDGQWQILQAGRFVAKKGMMTTLEAFADFRNIFPKARLTLAGEGPLREDLQKKVRDLGLDGAVDLPGFLDQSRLHQAFLATHVYLHPSETVDGDTEGVPNALLEAMAHGVPSIGTLHGGIPEVIENSVSGLLVPEKNPQALSDAMRTLASDTSLYQKLSRQGAIRVREEFSAEKGLRQIERIYSEAIAGGRHGKNSLRI